MFEVGRRRSEELRPVLLGLQQWGDRWACTVPPAVFEHDCGAALELTHVCKARGREVTGRDLSARALAPGWTQTGPTVEDA